MQHSTVQSSVLGKMVTGSKMSHILQRNNTFHNRPNEGDFNIAGQRLFRHPSNENIKNIKEYIIGHLDHVEHLPLHVHTIQNMTYSQLPGLFIFLTTGLLPQQPPTTLIKCAR